MNIWIHALTVFTLNLCLHNLCILNSVRSVLITDNQDALSNIILCTIQGVTGMFHDGILVVMYNHIACFCLIDCQYPVPRNPFHD